MFLDVPFLDATFIIENFAKMALNSQVCLLFLSLKFEV